MQRADLSVFEKGLLRHMAVLQISGEHIGNDPAVPLRTPADEAETNHKRHGVRAGLDVGEDDSMEVRSAGGRKPRIMTGPVLGDGGCGQGDGHGQDGLGRRRDRVIPNPDRTALGPFHTPLGAEAPDCSVIIVNYHTEVLLRGCLQSLRSSADTVSFEVLVVDNSGTALGSGALDALPGVRLIDAGSNIGFARACNLGMAAARGRHLLLLNPDTLAHPGAVATLSRHLDAYREVGVVAARLLNPDGTLQYSCRRFPGPFSLFFGRYAMLTRLFPRNALTRDYLYLDWDHATAQPVDWVSGACLMARREVLDRVGGLDDGYFLFIEDVDWCRRIRDAGLEVVYVPEAEVTHRIGASRGPVPPRVLWERHRSMLRYVRKHFGWPRGLVSLVGAGLALRAAVTIACDRLRGGRRLRDPLARSRPRRSTAFPAPGKAADESQRPPAGAPAPVT